MIIVLRPETTRAEADEILDRIAEQGLRPLYMPGDERVVLGALGDERVLQQLNLESYPQVERVTPILSPYKLVSREFHPADTVVHVGDAGGTKLGGGHFTVIAGPCAVESYDQMLEAGRRARDAGATMLRGGAFKPRTSPYSFQGLGVEGLKILRQVSIEVGLPTITEVVEATDLEAVLDHVDALQVGARNMQNYRLLTEIGRTKKPVLLKRGMAGELNELLLCAEYIVSEGNSNVILCERGIKTFGRDTRNTLDLAAVPLLKQRSHLPVVVDPSHGTGVRDLVAPMAFASAAAGADGVMVEMHPDPVRALSDGKQSLFPEQLAALVQGLGPFVEAAGRHLERNDARPVEHSLAPSSVSSERASVPSGAPS